MSRTASILYIVESVLPLSEDWSALSKSDIFNTRGGEFRVKSMAQLEISKKHLVQKASAPLKSIKGSQLSLDHYVSQGRDPMSDT